MLVVDDFVVGVNFKRHTAWGFGPNATIFAGYFLPGLGSLEGGSPLDSHYFRSP